MSAAMDILTSKKIQNQMFKAVWGALVGIYNLWTDGHVEKFTATVELISEENHCAVVNAFVEISGRIIASEMTSSIFKFVFTVDTDTNHVVLAAYRPFGTFSSASSRDMMNDYIASSPYKEDRKHHTNRDTESDTSTAQREVPFSTAPEITDQVLGAMSEALKDYIEESEDWYRKNGYSDVVVTVKQVHPKNIAIGYVLTNTANLSFEDRIIDQFLFVYYGQSQPNDSRNYCACFDMYSFDGNRGRIMTYGSKYCGHISNPKISQNGDGSEQNRCRATVVDYRDIAPESAEAGDSSMTVALSTANFLDAVAHVLTFSTRIIDHCLNKINGCNFSCDTEDIPFYIFGRFGIGIDDESEWHGAVGVYDADGNLNQNAKFCIAPTNQYWSSVNCIGAMPLDPLKRIVNDTMFNDDYLLDDMTKEMLIPIMPAIRKLPDWQHQIYRFIRDNSNLWQLTVFDAATVEHTPNGQKAKPIAEWFIFRSSVCCKFQAAETIIPSDTKILIEREKTVK